MIAKKLFVAVIVLGVLGIIYALIMGGSVGTVVWYMIIGLFMVGGAYLQEREQEKQLQKK
jgi:VIT1/CCC1 family predicted Fe2+/Mn2+ transporter